MTTALVLVLHKGNGKTQISADVSSYGLGGVLSQRHDNTCHLVCFRSWSLTPTEMRYTQIEKEALELTWVYKTTSDLKLGKSITGETDNKSLVPLLTLARSNSSKETASPDEINEV